MIIAIPTEAGQVFQHFGHTPSFTLYEVEDHMVVNTTVIDTTDSGHGALAARLKEAHVNLLICGGIGGGAVQALAESGIEVLAGVSGQVTQVIADYLSGKQMGSSEANCNHHGEGHHEGHHCQGHHDGHHEGHHHGEGHVCHCHSNQ